VPPALALFGKSKSKSDDQPATPETEGGKDAPADASAPAFKADPRKAERFFSHAQTVADGGNHDYAIELYINGLKHEPDNLGKHEALRDVALRRKVKGGKPAGFRESMKSGGSTPLDKMLHAEKLFSFDPLNVKHARDVMKYAVEADQLHDDLRMGEVAFWAGELLLEINQNAKKPDKNVYIQAKDLYVAIGRFDKAVECTRRALAFSPGDDTLLAQLKDLEAERTMAEGGYGAHDNAEEGGFRDKVRDLDKQRALEQESAASLGEDQQTERINRLKAEYEEDPQDLDKLQKLVEALTATEKPEREKEAIELLEHAWQESGQYRYKVRAGDVRMRMSNRYARQLKTALTKEPDNEELKEKAQAFARKQLAFELKEYQDRVKNYPTDMALRFELGKRLFAAQQFDEAIGAFQQAKADPKSRAQAHVYLGSCYTQKGWFDEAIDTLRAGIEAHQHATDRVAMQLRYQLMDALEQQGRKVAENDPARALDLAREAQQIGSQVLQTDISFRDIRDRVDTLRSLTDRLEKQKAGA